MSQIPIYFKATKSVYGAQNQFNSIYYFTTELTESLPLICYLIPFGSKVQKPQNTKMYELLFP